ncbi:hypothetical protein KC734_19515 [candidate division KSB1 bacterium]|nr:hypothetical protein [candidate division KSB1 bacterium]
MLLQLLLLEMRSIFRTRRMRQLFIANASALIFMLPMYFIHIDLKLQILLKIAVIAVIAINFAFFTFSKDGCIYDGLRSRKISSFIYVKAKYYYLSLLCAVGFLLLSVFELFGASSFWSMNIILLLLSVGFLLPLALLAASFDKERIDTSRSTFFNYEGVAWGRQALVLIPFFLIFFKSELAIKGRFILFILGLVCIFCYKLILKLITKIIERRKYLILEGFRE